MDGGEISMFNSDIDYMTNIKLILAYTYIAILCIIFISLIAIVWTESYIFMNLIITWACIDLIIAVLFFISKD